jgi:hypothetical protein
MLKLIPSLLLLISCSDRYKWGYRLCKKGTGQCSEHVAKFLYKQDCFDYQKRHGHRCLGGKNIRKAKVDDPVCWKAESTLARGECGPL